MTALNKTRRAARKALLGNYKVAMTEANERVAVELATRVVRVTEQMQLLEKGANASERLLKEYWRKANSHFEHLNQQYRAYRRKVQPLRAKLMSLQ